MLTINSINDVVAIYSLPLIHHKKIDNTLLLDIYLNDAKDKLDLYMVDDNEFLTKFKKETSEAVSQGSIHRNLFLLGGFKYHEALEDAKTLLHPSISEAVYKVRHLLNSLTIDGKDKNRLLGVLSDLYQIDKTATLDDVQLATKLLLANINSVSKTEVQLNAIFVNSFEDTTKLHHTIKTNTLEFTS